MQGVQLREGEEAQGFQWGEARLNLDIKSYSGKITVGWGGAAWMAERKAFDLVRLGGGGQPVTARGTGGIMLGHGQEPACSCVQTAKADQAWWWQFYANPEGHRWP